MNPDDLLLTDEEIEGLVTWPVYKDELMLAIKAQRDKAVSCVAAELDYWMSVCAYAEEYHDSYGDIGHFVVAHEWGYYLREIRDGLFAILKGES